MRAMKTPVCVGLLFVHTFAYSRRVLRGIRRYVEARPQWLLTSFTPNRRLPHILSRIRPQGLIAGINTRQLVATISAFHRPVVNVATVFPGLKFPYVGMDNVQVGRLAAEHFLERGLRHFGYIGSPDYLASSQREAAFCQAVQAAGYSVARHAGRTHPRYDSLGQRWELDPAVHRWLRALKPPVGVFVANDLWGVQVAEACRQVGLRVPEDVALLGVGDDDLYCELTRPPLSSIIPPAERIGYEAAALLERLLKGERPPARPILLPPIGVATRRSSEALAIDDHDVVAAVRFVREHAHLPIRVADVLQQVPVGRRTLERRCHKLLGWGLGEEIRRTHLGRARRLLAETDLPLKVLAEEAGFSDYRHMALAFRRALGITPTDYRRQIRSPVPGRSKS
jgi:LacI family transcriptional regulator